MVKICKKLLQTLQNINSNAFCQMDIHFEISFLQEQLVGDIFSWSIGK